jgi:hypothetical protein
MRSFSERYSGAWWTIRGGGPLRSVAELFVPFTLFEATIRHRGTTDVRLLAVDRFCGLLDPFMFDEPPSEKLESVKSRNRLDCVLSQEQAEEVLTTKLQRLFFQKGFFKVSGLEMNLVPLMPEIYMPYWLGLFGSGARASIKIIDATRRVHEGNKLRMGVEEWLLQAN